MRVDVLCCCDPDNHLGTVSGDEAIEVGTRPTIDEDGNLGEAVAVSDPGRTFRTFVPAEARGKKGGRTWAEPKKKPQRKRPKRRKRGK